MIELVWDQQRAGTATTPSGQWLAVGDNADFSPEDLIAIAAASCLMRTSAKLAADSGIDLLSFTATARFEGELPARRIHVRAQMVTPATVSEGQALELWSRVMRESAVACVLGDHLVTEIEVTRLLESTL